MRTDRNALTINGQSIDICLCFEPVRQILEVTTESQDLHERYRAQPEGSPQRRKAAYSLASSLMTRFIQENGPATERDLAIDLFEEALSGPGLPADLADIAHGAAGILLMQRVFPIAMGSDPLGSGLMTFVEMMTTRQGGDLARQRDARRASHHLQHVMDNTPADSPLRQQALLPLAALHLLPEAGPPDNAAATSILKQAVATVPAPQRVLAQGMLASVQAAQEPNLSAQQATQLADDIQRMLAALPPHPQLRAQVTLEMATVLGRLGATTGATGLLAEAPLLAEQALASMAEDDGEWSRSLRQLAGLLVAATAFHEQAEDVDRLMEMADRLVSEPADPLQAGKDRYLRGMVLILRGRRDANSADLRQAADEMCQALALMPADDLIVPSVVATLGALLNDRHLSHGMLTDAEAGRELISRARQVHQAQVAAGTLSAADAHIAACLEKLADAVAAIRGDDPRRLIQAIDGLRWANDGLPPGYPWRPRLDAASGLARLALGRLTGDMEQIRSGIETLRRTAEVMAEEGSGRPIMRAIAAITTLLRGLIDGDRETLLRAAARMDSVDAAEHVNPTETAAIWNFKALAHRILHDEGLEEGDIDTAITSYEQAKTTLVDHGDHRQAAQVCDALALAYRRRGEAGDSNRSIETGLDGLRARGRDVLLQTGAAHGLAAARHAAHEALRVARWCVADGAHRQAVEAIELGRGLVLHSATAAAGLPELLRDIGYSELALEWENDGAADAWSTEPQDTALAQVTDTLFGDRVPNDLRMRVLEALRGTAAAQRLASPPSVAEIAAALTTVQAVALAYLLPGDEKHDGVILLVTADGRVRCLGAEKLRSNPDRLGSSIGTTRDLYPQQATTDLRWPGEVCDWAWEAAIGPVLHDLGPAEGDRVILVPVGALAAVPWHAARWSANDGRPRYACDSVVISYAASARQLTDAAARIPLPRHDGIVLATDRDGGLPGALDEVEALKREIYPDALTLYTGTPKEVLGHLPSRTGHGAALLHLACHAYAGLTPDGSFLTLASTARPATPSRLTVAQILDHARGREPGAPGGLVVLAACSSDLATESHDEVLTLATAFLAAGAAGAVGARWPVDDAATTYFMYMFHHYLTIEGRSPSRALCAAQRWMRDPGRAYPAGLPKPASSLADAFAAAEFWAAFSYHGR